MEGYEAVYMFWATDFLPREIDLAAVFFNRTNTVHHVGSYWSANAKELKELVEVLKAKEINFSLSDPWKKITTNEQAVELIRKSYIAPDIRGSGVTGKDTTAEESNHLSTGYIPCRVFKNISYGQLGISNSPAVNALMGDYIVFSSDIRELVDKAEKHRQNYDKIMASMIYVKDNHTFINRANALLKTI